MSEFKTLIKGITDKSMIKSILIGYIDGIANNISNIGINHKEGIDLIKNAIDDYKHLD